MDFGVLRVPALTNNLHRQMFVNLVVVLPIIIRPVLVLTDSGELGMSPIVTKLVLRVVPMVPALPVRVILLLTNVMPAIQNLPNMDNIAVNRTVGQTEELPMT